MDNSYAQKVKDALFELIGKGSDHWAEEERVLDQARMIREAGFLDVGLLKTIKESIRRFDGDIWEIADMLIELCKNKPINFPSASIFAVFISYAFRHGDLADLQ